MDIIQLYRYYAYRNANSKLNVFSDSSLMVLFVQMQPFVLYEHNKYLLYKSKPPADSFLDYIEVLQYPQTDILHIQKKLYTDIATQLANVASKERTDDNFDSHPIHFIMHRINCKPPIQDLGISAGAIDILASAIMYYLAAVKIDPFVFVSSCCDSEGKSNHFADILMCRRLFYDAVQHHRIDCIVVNEFLFREEKQKVQDFEDLQKQNQKFSSYICCRKCKALMVTMTPQHLGLAMDEISYFRAYCHNESCRHVFICKG